MRRPIVLVVVVLSLASCGTTTAPATSTSTSTASRVAAEIQAGPDFNDTDVMFLQMLAYHQKQGLEMTTTAAARSQSRDLKNLAAAVGATEKDELTMMRSWLEQWHRPTEVDTATSLHADHGGLPATGPAEIKALKTVRSADFDSAFLNLFLAHQHNAIEMAHLETANGQNKAVKDLAGRVRDSRQGEIKQMLQLLSDE